MNRIEQIRITSKYLEYLKNLQSIETILDNQLDDRPNKDTYFNIYEFVDPFILTDLFTDFSNKIHEDFNQDLNALPTANVFGSN